MNAFSFDYEITKTMDGNGIEGCYYANSSRRNGSWQNKIALSTSLPIFLMQLALVLFINQLVIAILKPLRQPRIVGQVITGVLLGPSTVARTGVFKKYIFPLRTMMVLETFANMALVFHMFMVGLETDLNLISRSGTKVFSIAFAGILIPMVVGFSLYLLAFPESQNSDNIGGYVFWAVALSATNFPELTRILIDLKLLRTDVGRTSLSSSLISDFCTWLLLVSILTINAGQYYAVLSIIVFILLCVFALRPALSWIFRNTLKGENLSDRHIWFVLAGILLCGFVSDGCGAHSILGAFMLGVIMPREKLITGTLRERLNDMVTGIWMPIFFLTSGFRTNIAIIFTETSWKIVLLVLVSSCLTKIASTFLVSLLYRVPPKDGLALGLLMNTKGVLALIVLNTGRNMQALNNHTFPLMIFSLLVMTSLIEPVLACIYKPKMQLLQYKCRTIEITKEEAEFRILACFHSTNVSAGMINLLQVSNATQVFAVHLVGHSTAVLIVHDEPESDQQFMNGFENYEKRIGGCVTVQKLTCVCPYQIMDEDICGLAEDKRVNLIIIPFHKQITGNGRMRNPDSDRSPITGVNQRVLAKAPCSVGIFVDRGLSLTKVAESKQEDRRIEKLVLFFTGGPDDREALAYAWRMAEHPHVKLTLVRFLPGKDHVAKIHHHEDHEDCISTDVIWDFEREKKMDDEDIYEFKFKTINDKSISYIEKMVNNGEETVAAIKEEGDNCDLYIVGRGKEVVSPLNWGLSNGSSYPELGIMGDIILGTFNFASSHASILVIQQYSS